MYPKSSEHPNVTTPASLNFRDSRLISFLIYVRILLEWQYKMWPPYSFFANVECWKSDTSSRENTSFRDIQSSLKVSCFSSQGTSSIFVSIFKHSPFTNYNLCSSGCVLISALFLKLNSKPVMFKFPCIIIGQLKQQEFSLSV